MAAKTQVAIVGFGNIGRGVLKSVEKNSDMELSLIVSRNPRRVFHELGPQYGEFTPRVVNANERGDEWAELKNEVDVAIICGGSKTDIFGDKDEVKRMLDDRSIWKLSGEELRAAGQGPYFSQYFSTVDSFDTHGRIPDYVKVMDHFAKKAGNVSVVCAGWDPGTFSVQRVEGESFIPQARAYMFYGLTEKGGLSMGHSDAIRDLKSMGVTDARQYTHAILEALERVRTGENPELSSGEMVWRECFVVLEDEGDKRTIEEAIKSMEYYFAPYRTEVHFVTAEELRKAHGGMPHDGLVITVGKTGDGNKAMIEYRNEWASNPEATGNILVACARAAHRLSSQNGAYTMLDIAPAYYSPHPREVLLQRFM